MGKVENEDTFVTEKQNEPESASLAGRPRGHDTFKWKRTVGIQRSGGTRITSALGTASVLYIFIYNIY